MTDKWPDGPFDLRALMASYASAVTVMTTVLPDGEPHGMTANAVSSVSVEPALLLVCVDRGTRMAQAVLASQRFGLSFLTSAQEDLSARFADPSRPYGASEFDGVTTRLGTTGCLVIEPNVGWAECRVWDVADGGDHHVILGEVVDGGEGVAHDALLFYRRAYYGIGPG